MKTKQRTYFTKASLLICLAVILYTAFFYYPKWQQTRTEATLSWDKSDY